MKSYVERERGEREMERERTKKKERENLREREEGEIYTAWRVSFKSGGRRNKMTEEVGGWGEGERKIERKKEICMAKTERGSEREG